MNSKCKDDEILNPKTHRCVKRSGAIGKEILKSLEKKASKCKEDEILNPVTNRCVKRSGAIGKKLLKKDKSGEFVKTVADIMKYRNVRNKKDIKTELKKLNIDFSGFRLNDIILKIFETEPELVEYQELFEELIDIVEPLIELGEVKTKKDIKTILKHENIYYEKIVLSNVISYILHHKRNL